MGFLLPLLPLFWLLSMINRQVLISVCLIPADYSSRGVRLAWIFLGAPQTFNGAQGNTRGSLHWCVVHFTNVLFVNTLRQWQNGRHFVNDIFKCFFLNRNVFEFRLKFHWSLIPASNWQFSNIGSVNGLATGVIAIVWTNDGYQVYRRIYASLGLIGLTRLYWDRLSHFSPYAFIVFWIVLVYCMPQFYMGSNKDFFELNLNLNGGKTVFTLSVYTCDFHVTLMCLVQGLSREPVNIQTAQV